MAPNNIGVLSLPGNVLLQMSKKIAQSLTKLESEVMAVVWDAAPDSVCVRDVVEGLNDSRAKRREKELAYNTVQTVMTLLKQKKVVRQVKGKGRAHYFEALVSRDDASRRVLAELSQRVFGGEVKPLIHQLIGDAKMSSDELAELKKWVDAKLKDSRRSES